MPFFSKKPVVIEARHFTPAVAASDWKWTELADWCGGMLVYGVPDRPEEREILIETLEGAMSAEVGDWIVKGVKGEFYPIKPDIFEETYKWEYDKP